MPKYNLKPAKMFELLDYRKVSDLTRGVLNRNFTILQVTCTTEELLLMRLAAPMTYEIIEDKNPDQICIPDSEI